ncbi:hypothetical protein Salat_2626600 [Sesamum alatum]|uniref:Uncharacterized protein n=1 Tax=Sesamum alatum TaxID=300844 RepID=A0AAE1XNQ4_9LAMI|nr:hypothetical protein Salat_2626600 [Sesamum alatum]
MGALFHISIVVSWTGVAGDGLGRNDGEAGHFVSVDTALIGTVTVEVDDVLGRNDGEAGRFVSVDTALIGTVIVEVDDVLPTIGDGLRLRPLPANNISVVVSWTGVDGDGLGRNDGEEGRFVSVDIALIGTVTVEVDDVLLTIGDGLHLRLLSASSISVVVFWTGVDGDGVGRNDGEDGRFVSVDTALFGTNTVGFDDVHPIGEGLRLRPLPANSISAVVSWTGVDGDGLGSNDGVDGSFVSVDIVLFDTDTVEVDNVRLAIGEGLRPRPPADGVGDLYLELTSLDSDLRVVPLLLSAETSGRVSALDCLSTLFSD